MSVFYWIPPALVAECSDWEFQTGMLRLADRAVELKEGSAESLMARASLLWALGKTEQMQADIERAIQQSPTDAKARNNLAWYIAAPIGSEPEFIRQAMDLAKQAVSLASDKSMFWNTLGVVQYRASEFDAAIESLEKSTELSDGIPPDRRRRKGPRVLRSLHRLERAERFRRRTRSILSRSGSAI